MTLSKTNYFALTLASFCFGIFVMLITDTDQPRLIFFISAVWHLLIAGFAWFAFGILKAVLTQQSFDRDFDYQLYEDFENGTKQS